MPGKKRKIDKKAGFGQGAGPLIDASIAANFPKSLPQAIKIELRKMLGRKDGGKVQKLSGGGEADPKTDLEKQMEALQEIMDAETQGGFAGTDSVTDKDREAMKKFMRNMKKGGSVKGYKYGGPTGTSYGKEVCRGMGAARTGGKFKIR
jgi:hypothetical protein